MILQKMSSEIIIHADIYILSLLENYQLTEGNRGSLGLLWWAKTLEKNMPALQLEHIRASSPVIIDAKWV